MVKTYSFRFFSLVFVLFPITSFLYPALPDAAPLAKKGILDLSDWNAERDGLIGLDGEWEFYWHQLYGPQDFVAGARSTLSGYLEAPGYWDGFEVESRKLTGIGFGTLRLTVINVPGQTRLALDIPLMHTAYNLWINGKLISSNGEVGRTKHSSLPQYLPRTPVLNDVDKTMEIVLQISNFHHNNGGIWQTIKIGSVDDVMSTSQLRTAFDLFMLGAILIMALYHFALFVLRRREYSTWFFGLFCLVVSFRLSIHGSTIFSVLFPNASWEVLVKLDYFTLYFGLSFYIAFIRSLYPLEFSQKVFNLVVLISAGFVLFSTFVPAVIFTAYLKHYQVVMVLTCLYVIYALIRAVINKREGARLVVAGCMVIIATLVNDILYNAEVIHTADLVGIGLLLMIFSQSFVLSSRFSKAFKMVEVLSIHLDKMVKERTAAIKDLLDNTGQGFFSFADDYKIHKYTSKATYDFFQKSIEDEDVITLLFPEKAGEQRELLNLVFENAGNLDLVEDMLPSELVRNDKTFKVDYHWINPSENLHGRIMIVMTDITTQRKLELQLQKDEIRNQMILKIAVDRNGFIDFLSEVNRCLSMVDDSLMNEQTAANPDDLFRHFHTIKGGMSSYFFLDVSAKAHHIENLLEEVRKGAATFTMELKDKIEQETSELRKTLDETLNSLEQIVPREMIEARSQNYFMVAEAKLAQLEKALGHELTKNQLVVQAIRNFRKQPLRNIFKKFAADAETLAEQMDKKVTITLTGEETEIIHQPYKALFASLIHLIRNSIDHGIEHPDLRKELGKPVAGHLEIKIHTDENTLKLSISDDGAGIEPAAVKNKALKTNLISQEAATAMSDEDLIKLIFKPGFSTNEEITDLSGRGVGMDAVADEVAKLRGNIKIKTKVAEGTTFLLSIPDAQA